MAEKIDRKSVDILEKFFDQIKRGLQSLGNLFLSNCDCVSYLLTIKIDMTSIEESLPLLSSIPSLFLYLFQHSSHILISTNPATPYSNHQTFLPFIKTHPINIIISKTPLPTHCSSIPPAPK